MKLKIEQYTTTDQWRSFSAGNDADWYDVTVTRWRIICNGNSVYENIESEFQAKRYVEAWSNKKSTVKKSTEILNEFKANQKKELVEFKKRLNKWKPLRNIRSKLLKEGRTLPEELLDLSKVLEER